MIVNLNFTTYNIHKINSEGIKYVNIRGKTKNLGRNVSMNLHDYGLCNF
jgi:hypothetical protein